MNQLALIESLGFRPVGKWLIRGAGLEFEIESVVRQKKPSLYAFVDGTEVLYIGKSTGPFAGRLCGYRRPGSSQPTNRRVNPLILELLRTKKELLIYHFEAREQINFRGVALNVAAGLEDSLIASICPKWNMHGRTAQDTVSERLAKPPAPHVDKDCASAPVEKQCGARCGKAQIIPEELVRFVRGRGELRLYTLVRHLPLIVRTAADDLEFIPSSTQNPRTLKMKFLARICDEFNRTNSWKPGDYHSITFDASYTLSLIDAYLKPS